MSVIFWSSWTEKVCYVWKIQQLLEARLWPVVEDGLVGVEAAAWLRAWAGMSIEAKDGLLDNSGGGGEKPSGFKGYQQNFYIS